MDSYAIFHPDTRLQTPNSSFWIPKHNLFREIVIFYANHSMGVQNDKFEVRRYKSG